MARLKDPKYRLHRQSGRAVVTLRDPLSGRRRDVLLGKHGTPASHAEYARVVENWNDAGQVLDALPKPDKLTPPDMSVSRLLLDYLEAEKKRAGVLLDTKPLSSNMLKVKGALKRCRSVAGGMDARAFGPRALSEVRDAIVAEGLTRQHINQLVRIIVRAFSWGVSQERIPAEKVDAMKHLRPLQRGEQGTIDKPRIKPVPVDHVEPVMKYLTPQVAAMVSLMRYTGMRPNEVVQLRLADIDMAAKTWTYSPQKHKTQHHDIERFIPMGPQAQRILAPYLTGRLLTAAVFSPVEAEQWMRGKRRATRKTPMSCGNRPGTKRVVSPKRKPGETYTVGSVCRAVTRACKKAGVPVWTPRQLRKTFATEIRRD